MLIKWIEWHALAIAGMRSAIAAVFLYAVLRRPQFVWSRAQVGGGIACAASVLFFVTATKLTTAANAILLVYTAPLYVALLSPWFLQEKTTKLDWVSIFLVLGGMGLFFLDRLTMAGWWGNICAMASGFATAWVVLCLRQQKDTAPLETVLLGNIIAACAGVPFMFRTLPDVASWVALLLAGTVQLGLAAILYVQAIKHVRAVEAILIPVIEPILNPLWVMLLVGEAPGLWAIVGGAIVILSLTVRGLVTSSMAPVTSQAAELCYNQRSNSAP